MDATVYIETSIPSFYHEVRTEPSMVARRVWTRRWWADASSRYDLVTSPVVIEELQQGDYPFRAQCLDLLRGVSVLAIEPPVMDIVEAYIARHVMPANPAGDALHLALASFHRCDFLLT